MNFIEGSLLILFIAILSVPLANRLKMPLEIFLFFGSCLISLMPALPRVKIDPLIVFDLFLPPILFSAAYFTSWKDFKFNLRPIIQLALGLVLFTALMVGIAAKLLLPGFTWAEAFLLGAIVSPTDASAATAIIRKLGAPRRIIVLLEGESLVNDATALILYRFALAAILYGSFSYTNAISSFCILIVGGLLTGLIIAYFAFFILKQLKDIQAETAFTFITAFASYLIAEHCGFSGVIATVTAGVLFGYRIPEFASSAARLNARYTWSTVLFIINGFIFTLIGFQIPTIINELQSYSLSTVITYGVIISLVVILSRLIWIYPSAYIPRKLFPSIARKDPMPSWQMLFTIGWVGMRGIVSLAAVLAVPMINSTDSFSKHLSLLIFITYCVIAVTLILPTVTLPFLIRWLKLEPNDKLREEALARVRTIQDVMISMDILAKEREIPDKIYKEFISHYERKRKIFENQISNTPFSTIPEDYFIYKQLLLAAIEYERTVLNKLRKSGEIHDEIFWQLSEELDIEAMRAKSTI